MVDITGLLLGFDSPVALSFTLVTTLLPKLCQQMAILPVTSRACRVYSAKTGVKEPLMTDLFMASKAIKYNTTCRNELRRISML